MTMTYDQWKKQQGEDVVAEGRLAALTERLMILERAAVSADKLTHDENWDRYVSYLEGAAKEAVERRALLVDRLTAMDETDPSKLLSWKLLIANLDGVIETLVWSAGLPKALKATGDVARLHLAQIGEPRQGNLPL